MALDENALAEDGDLVPVGVSSAQRAMSSAPLNLRDGYMRRCDDPIARKYLEQRLSASDALQPEGHRTMVRSEPRLWPQRNEAISVVP